MTTIEPQVFFDDWSCRADLERDFQTEIGAEWTILVASYTIGSYEGFSYVLAEKDGTLYENEAGHCSCNGLEGSWEPAPITRVYLERRVAEAPPIHDVQYVFRALCSGVLGAD